MDTRTMLDIIEMMAEEIKGRRNLTAAEKEEFLQKLYDLVRALEDAERLSQSK